MNATTYLLLAVVVINIVYTAIAYNKLIKKQNLMLEAWSIIDVYLKKRAELVPNLVQVVKAYGSHEKEVLAEVTRYRSDAIQAKDQGIRFMLEGMLTRKLDQLIISLEHYPTLKADEQFLELQKEISKLENELELARRYYNGTVRENNTYVQRFPSNAIAWTFNFKKGVFFASNPEDRVQPEIDFNN